MDYQAQLPLQRADKLNLLVLRHGLAFIVGVMLLFTLLPFAAPLAIHWGWESIGGLLYRLYSPFCHQLPQRSWFLFGDKLTYTLAEIQQVYPATSLSELRSFIGAPTLGWKVAWSDRMISFYTMTPVFGLLYLLLRRAGKQIAPLPLVVLMAALLPLAIDGGTHVINDAVAGISSGGGFRDTNQWLAWLTFDAFPGFYAGDQFGAFNWWARLMTGALAAWSVAFALFPYLDRIFEQEAKLTTRRQHQQNLAESSGTEHSKVETIG